MRSGQGKRKLSGKYMRTRKATGQKINSLKIVEKAFEKIEKEKKQNPIQVYIAAIENSAPREDTTRIRRGGVVTPISVDVSSLKRLDEAIKNIALAAFAESFKSRTRVEDALAKEIILAAGGDASSYAIKRKNEIERIARASR